MCLTAWLLLVMATAAVAHGDGPRAYVADGSTGGLAIVDVSTGAIVGTVDLQGTGVTDVAISPDGTRAYAAQQYEHTVSVIDTATGEVVATVPVGLYPMAVAVSPDGSRVYVASQGGPLTVIDTAANAVVQEINYFNFLLDVAVSPDGTHLLWVENNTKHYGPMLGAIAIADADTGEVLARVPVYDPSSITVSADGTRAYAVDNRGGFSVIDMTSQTVVATVEEGNALFGGLAVSPDGTRIYIVDRGAGTLVVLDGATHAAIERIAVGSAPTNVAVSPDGTRVVVSSASGLSIIDSATNDVVATAALGSPGAVAFEPDPVQTPAAPTSKEQCKRGGWRAYRQFRNEGECVRFVMRR